MIWHRGKKKPTALMVTWWWALSKHSSFQAALLENLMAGQEHSQNPSQHPPEPLCTQGKQGEHISKHDLLQIVILLFPLPHCSLLKGSFWSFKALIRKVEGLAYQNCNLGDNYFLPAVPLNARKGSNVIYLEFYFTINPAWSINIIFSAFLWLQTLLSRVFYRMVKSAANRTRCQRWFLTQKLPLTSWGTAKSRRCLWWPPGAAAQEWWK